MDCSKGAPLKFERSDIYEGNGSLLEANGMRRKLGSLENLCTRMEFGDTNQRILDQPDPKLVHEAEPNWTALK